MSRLEDSINRRIKDGERTPRPGSPSNPGRRHIFGSYEPPLPRGSRLALLRDAAAQVWGEKSLPEERSDEENKIAAKHERQVIALEKQIISRAISSIARCDFQFNAARFISEDFDANIKGLPLGTENPVYAQFRRDVAESKKDYGASIFSDIERGDKYKILVAFKAFSELYDTSFNPNTKTEYQGMLRYVQKCARDVIPQRPS
jgi:hypothetical protein